MSLESHFEAQKPSELSVSEKYLKAQSEALQIAFDNDDKAILSWISDPDNVDFSRKTIIEYLTTHEVVDIAELADIVRKRVEETQTLH